MTYDPSKDQLAFSASAASAPARRSVTLTASDSTDLSTYAKALFIGTGGNVKAIPVGNADAAPVTFKNLPSGAILPVQVRRVFATDTTAADIVALYD